MRYIFNENGNRPISITAKMDELLGYTQEELRQHIKNHPNWNLVKNEKWHLDHIFPFKAFFEYKIYDTKLINSLENIFPTFLTPSLFKVPLFIFTTSANKFID